MIALHTVRREGAHTGDGDYHLVCYIGYSGVVFVCICIHAVLNIDPLYV